MKIEGNSIYVKRIEIKPAQKKELESIKNEDQILSKIKSEHVVRYFDSFQDKDSFNIIIEFCEGLDLRNFINEYRENKNVINENLIFCFILHICLGLKEIHDQNLIHRDLKPDNLFITGDNTIKIGDFGISKQLQNENECAKTQIETMIYMAP
jgi:NIMA (never in mitosis gene a)-related kinase